MELDAEILQDFRTESEGLMDELEAVVEDLEASDGAAFPDAKLKEFSQKIDRIMGAAKTLLSFAPGHPGITFIANVSEMCKTMGYQAVALQKTSLVPFFAGFLAETVEVMREVLVGLGEKDGAKAIVQAHSTQLEKRLKWLAEKVAPDSEEEKQKVVALLKRL